MTAPAAAATIRALIVDDEALSRQRVRRLLRAERDVSVVGECADGAAAVEAIARLAPDVVFLDVQMPELDGFGVLRRLADGAATTAGDARQPLVVFVTAYDQYAIRAFDVHALDYLLKPFTAERFRDAVQRVRAALVPPDASARRSADARIAALLAQLSAELQLGGATPAGSAPNASSPARRRTSGPQPRVSAASAAMEPAAASEPAARPTYPDRIAVRDDGRVIFVRVADVDWAEAAGNYVRLHVGREVHLVRETMAALEAALDPGRFVRIHRSAIVAVDRIKELQPWFAGDYVVTLHNGVKLRMSRTYRENIETHAGRLSRSDGRV
jgi:two-component system LytT family response regulator